MYFMYFRYNAYHFKGCRRTRKEAVCLAVLKLHSNLISRLKRLEISTKSPQISGHKLQTNH